LTKGLLHGLLDSGELDKWRKCETYYYW